MPKKTARPKKYKTAQTVHYDVTPDRAWFDERCDQLGLAKGQLVTDLGITRNAMSDIWAGKRKVNVAELLAWARLLDVPLELMVRKFGFTELAEHSVPVVGRVTYTGRVSLFLGVEPKRVDAPPRFTDATQALVVEERIAGFPIGPGSYLYYNRSQVIQRDAAHVLSYVDFSGDMSPIIAVFDPQPDSRGRHRLLPIGAPDYVIRADLHSAAPVMWIQNA